MLVLFVRKNGASHLRTLASLPPTYDLPSRVWRRLTGANARVTSVRCPGLTRFRRLGHNISVIYEEV